MRLGNGLSARALVRRFGSPLFVYSAEVARDRLALLRGVFGRRDILVCYALKANSCRALGRVLAREGAGADIVSGGELVRARRAGFPASKTVFSGVGKTASEMSAALRAGILSFNVESGEEMEALARVARRLKRRAPVSVRLNPDVDPGTHPHVSTGRADNKFGVRAGEALALYRKAARDPRLRVVGIQCHIGSQVVSLEPHRLAAAAVARAIGTLAGAGIRLDFADFGGGIAVTYKNERPFSLREFAGVVEDRMRPWPWMRILLEPGRYLVADAGTLLTRVLYRKQTSRRNFIIVDAAMTDLPRPALYGSWHPVEAVSPRRGPRKTVDVVGPVCESGDFLARARRLPPLEPGDLIAVGKAGAYAFSMSSQYNSRPRAAEVLVDGRRAVLARRRETLRDLYAAEN